MHENMAWKKKNRRGIRTGDSYNVWSSFCPASNISFACNAEVAMLALAAYSFASFDVADRRAFISVKTDYFIAKKIGITIISNYWNFKIKWKMILTCKSGSPRFVLAITVRFATVASYGWRERNVTRYASIALLSGIVNPFINASSDIAANFLFAFRTFLMV